MNPNQNSMGFQPLPVGSSPIGYQPPNYSNPGGLVYPGNPSQQPQPLQPPPYPGGQIPQYNQMQPPVSLIPQPYPNAFQPTTYAVTSMPSGILVTPQGMRNPPMPPPMTHQSGGQTVLQPIVIHTGGGPSMSPYGGQMLDKKAQKKLEKEQKKAHKKKK